MEHVFDMAVGESVAIGSDTVVIITGARTTQAKLGILSPHKVAREEALSQGQGHQKDS